MIVYYTIIEDECETRKGVKDVGTVWGLFFTIVLVATTKALALLPQHCDL